MSGRSALTLVVALLGLALSSPLRAQVEPGEDFATINIGPDGLSLDEAVEFAEEATGKTFIYAENIFRGKKVMISGIAKVPRDKLYEFWQAVFATQGFAMVPMGPEKGDFINIEAIDASRQLKQRARYVAVEELAGIQRKVGEVVMTTITLENVGVAQVRQAVNQILQNRNAEFVHEVQSANSLIVVGFAPTVYAIYQLTQAMDQPVLGLELKFEILELRYAVAEEIIGIITELIATTGTGTPGVPRPGNVRNPAGGDGARPWQERPEPKIIADPRTNSIVVYATGGDMAEIKRLIAALDTEVTEIDSNIRIYFLKNTNADDMEGTLRDVLGQGTTRSTRAVGTTGRPGTGGPSTVNERGQEVSIVADGNTNALIITCTQTRYREIEALIKELDKRRPQVLVEAAIAELSDDDIQAISAEITALEGGDDSFLFGGATGYGLSTITSAVDGGSGDPGDPAAGTFLNNLVRVPFLNATGTGVSFTGLVAGIFDDSLNVPLLVSLLKNSSKSNLVSVPSVLTNDNEQSTIKVSREVPTVSFQTTAAGTDQQSFQGYQEAKLELKISPHISNDNYLRLEIELIVEAFTGIQVSAGVPPPKTTREFVGNVTVPNGKTVVIGGLVQDNYTRTIDGVPYLSEIPILGWLFSSESESLTKQTLYLFVTPTIFKDFQSLEEVSYAKKLEIQKLEGNVKLIDPNFREVGLENSTIGIDDIEASGALDVPRFSPMTPIGEGARVTEVDGIPIKPKSSESGTEATIHEAGTFRVLDRNRSRAATRPTDK